MKESHLRAQYMERLLDDVSSAEYFTLSVLYVIAWFFWAKTFVYQRQQQVPASPAYSIFYQLIPKPVISTELLQTI
jgi:hypothetical protein